MAGELTRHFGEELVRLLSTRLKAVWDEFPEQQFGEIVPSLNELTLMKRVRRIAEGLVEALPDTPQAAWQVMEAALPAPLLPDEKTFNDGYWMLPLAEYWALGPPEEDEFALCALEALTQRGTAEFAVRPIAERSAQLMLQTAQRWSVHESFHVRRLASEGTRPYLPWSGKLKVSAQFRIGFRTIAEGLLDDESAYVRRSAQNHLKDWKRLHAQ